MALREDLRKRNSSHSERFVLSEFLAHRGASIDMHIDLLRSALNFKVT